MISICQNINIIKSKMNETALRTGRDPKNIEIVAVTKTVGIQEIQELVKCGHCIIGESKVQDALKKQELIDDNISWHFIGHLQTNKVKYIVGKFDLIHSVDTLKLVDKIHKEALKKHTKQNILLEVNVTGEEAKYGFSPEQVKQVLPKMADMMHVNVLGLMTMAPYTDEESIIRSCFRGLVQLQKELVAMNVQGVRMDHLSMGMTNDFLIAIEEGATIVRIGSAIFHQNMSGE